MLRFGATRRFSPVLIPSGLWRVLLAVQKSVICSEAALIS